MKAFDYYSALEQHAAGLQESCALLLKCCTGYDFFLLGEQARQARVLADRCAQGHTALAQAVLADFLPPLQREDVLGLSQALERLTGQAAQCLGLMEALRAAQLPEGAAALGKIIARQGELLARGMGGLRALKKSSGALLEGAQGLRALGREGMQAALGAYEAAGRLADPRRLLLSQQVTAALGGLCQGMAQAGAVLETAAVKNI